MHVAQPFLPITEFGIETVTIDIFPCDHNFQAIYKFEIIEGQFFDDSFSKNKRKIVLNETLAKSLKMKNCIGQIIVRESTEYEIIGIVKDFHFNSKQSTIPSLALLEIPDMEMFWPPAFCSVLVSDENPQNTLTEIEKTWQKIAPGTEFSYAFFDQEYDMLYKQEMYISKVFILLACHCFLKMAANGDNMKRLGFRATFLSTDKNAEARTNAHKPLNPRCFVLCVGRWHYFIITNSLKLSLSITLLSAL